ncbi:related to ATP-binding cassette, sub-family G, member 2 [Melanopsichium pennsylvanicum]|uniref:Related to ATP-binding cassette, sub-family G, member 2 n=2 Tax=Melanopsichium pennsylvanicum TaxID=63383 RepID=A0AAJ5C6R7_9BASI|nr:related to ATP-binding cassette, sub-family G, member 2 [Melanopsichium pennsylvanicum 4]SNX86145.1 related to ATP-binding cassette, sub-family G, member 2 [Melanopsichium pennsylvanicum]
MSSNQQQSQLVAAASSSSPSTFAADHVMRSASSLSSHEPSHIAKIAPIARTSGADLFSWRDITYDVLLSKARCKEINTQGRASPSPSSSSSVEIRNTVTQEKSKQAEVADIASPSHSVDEALDEYQQVFDHLPPLDPMRRRVLNGVSGHVKKGDMVAILGASGAGKTSLLSVLSARLDKSSDIAGEVLFQGKQRDPATWKRLTGFVEQDDLMFSALTVHETLQYSADLRLPKRLYNKKECQQRVYDSISMLRLEKCKDTRIGGPNQRGVSGGERKRVAVGTELVADVSVLLLDEPTSGLDAFAALNLVKNLKEITRERNLYTLMTIHQPSWNIFKHFDKVILLTRGQIYYAGPPTCAPAWFASLGHNPPEGVNPADHYITIAENYEKTNAAEKRVRGLLAAWRESGEVFVSTQAAKELSLAPSRPGELERKQSRIVPKSSDATDLAGSWPNSWLHEFLVLTHRNAMLVFKDPIIVLASFGQNIVLLIIIGFAFFRLSFDQGGALARVGALFIIPVNASFAVLFPILAIFPLQRNVMLRERSAGTYRISSFYLSKIMTEVPNQLFQRILFYAIVYWMVGLRQTASAFFIWVAINVLQIGTAIGLGLVIGCGAPSIELANVFAPVINVIFLLFGGNLLPLSSIPPWFIWLHWMSPITYSYSALAQNEFKDLQFECEADSKQCYRTGQDVLNQYDLQRFTIAQNAGFLGAITLVFLAIGYVLLRWLGRPSFRYVQPKTALSASK